jgi:hypothetical protein
MAETSFLHEELMQEEGLTIRDLPVAFQHAIKGWNVTKRKYDENPSEKEELRSIRISTDIANKMQNWIESRSDDEDDDDNDGKNNAKNNSNENKRRVSTTESNTTKRRSVEKDFDEEKPNVKTDAKAEPKKPVTTGVSFGNFVMEKKIKSICEANGGRIKITQLKSILNKEPDYPEQKVHNIKLRKVFLSSDYRIV